MTLNKCLLHESNQILKDLYMLNIPICTCKLLLHLPNSTDFT